MKETWVAAFRCMSEETLQELWGLAVGFSDYKQACPLVASSHDLM